jgi:hypothetical protein
VAIQASGPLLALAILAGAIACGRESSSLPGPPPAASTPAPRASADAVPPLAPGNRVPEAVLAGARHWDRGGAAGNRILVVNFNLDEERLRAVHDQVRIAPVLKGAAGLLTLTADPNAMPAVLRAHADRLQADAEVWRFAALAPSDANTVLQQFGAASDRGVLAIVDAEGNLAKIYAGSAWSPDDIVRDLKSLVLRADPAVIAAYVAAQEGLARDDVSSAKRELLRLSRAVGEPAVSRLAATAANGRDIAAVRAAFKPLSEALVRLPWPRQYQPMYCPMYDGTAGATWVQKAGPVTNPYYGGKMLRCGTDLSIGAHADHSPLFGGVLFMAADQFHHIEGTYTEDGVFRVRVYDNFKKQISARGFKGTAAPGDKEPVLRLTPAADGMTLDAKVGALPFPAEITVMMTLDPRGPDERFDFVFPSYSPRQ